MNESESSSSQVDRSRLQSLMKMAALINSSLDQETIRRNAVRLATSCVGADAGSLLLLDQDTKELYFEAVTGEKGDMLKWKRLKSGQGIAGWVAQNGTSVVVADVSRDQRFLSAIDNVTGYTTRSTIVVPLVSKERILGVLQVVNKIDGNFSSEDLEMMEALANLVATAIENSHLFREQRETFLGVTMAFAEALERRDKYTGGHTRRVCDYSLAIGRRLGLSPPQIEELRLSAILHDIGKIGVADCILQKPGKLEQEEFIAISKHPRIGAEILEHVKSLRQLLEGILFHHEKFDGSGYPDGLSSEEIPLTARIIAVADTFDALTSNRAYRNAHSARDALNELERCSGTQFDPGIVKAFLEAYHQGELTNAWDEYTSSDFAP